MPDIVHRLVVIGDNDVTGLDARLGSRAARHDGGDECTHRFLEMQRLRHGRCDILHFHAQIAELDRLVVLEVLHHPHHGIDGNRERQAHVAAAVGIDLIIDAHHLALHVEERSARVAGIDGHVALDEGDVFVIGQRAVHGTDHPLGHGVVKAERRADGE